MGTLTDAQARSYTYNNANELLSQGSTAFTYDANGNLTNKTDTSGATLYQYDYENRLIKAAMPNGTTAEYKYDPFGRRIEKKITDASGIKTYTYTYDNEDIILEYLLQTPNSEPQTTRYIHGPGIDEPLAIQHSSADYYYHADALGSITRMTDQNGNTVQTYKYDSFGNITASSILQPYAYTGREYDKETGLYYYRGRYYDPKTGRFISKDPIGFGGGINVYVAMGNNPVNYMDPSGLFNPVKGGVALLNAANAGRLYAIGFLKLAAAAGFNATGVGAPVGAGLIASGYWNMWSGYAAQRRGLQQWGEALQENWCDAASRNLLGILPLGQAYDDSSEPTPFEYLRNLYDKVQDDPSLIWKLIQEFGTLGW